MGTSTQNDDAGDSGALSEREDRTVRTGVADTVEVIALDDGRRPDLTPLADGTFFACYQCGVCTASCPWGLVKDDTFSVRKLMRAAQLGRDGGPAELWLCTTCGQCEAYCPRGVKIGEVMLGLRHLAWQDRRTPAGLPTLLWSLHGNNNPWGQPPSARSLWARDLDIPLYDAHKHEILMYVGCTAAYDHRVQDVAKALVRLLRLANVRFGYLADEEPCCGESALSLGHEPLYDELINTAGDKFRRHEVSRMVTISPHCYDSFKNRLPADLEKTEVLHYVQYLAQLISEGRFPFVDGQSTRVTFHDPCYLARRHDEVDSPRRILDAVPGFEVVEMAHHGPDTLCCGGGGGRMWLETVPEERLANIRIREASATGAQLLLTACPFCLTCLEDSRKALKIQDLRVLDVAEALLLALKSEPA